MPASKVKLLILCGDNRWRSPLAHALMGQYHKLECLSAGFEEEEGQLPPKAILVAAKALGLKLDDYRSVAMTIALLQWADYFVCADPFVKAQLKAFAQEVGSRWSHSSVIMLGYYTKERQHLPDPLDYEDFGYHEVEDMIDRIVYASHALARHLLTLAE